MFDPLKESTDTERPSPSRMYDYLLGGYHNLAVDRQAADQMISLVPNMRIMAQTNRAFLQRATTFLVEQGIEQFLDLGSGIPTVGNVHEVVHQLNPTARVVYVDVDPVAVAQSKAILGNTPTAAIIQADIRDLAACRRERKRAIFFPLWDRHSHFEPLSSLADGVCNVGRTADFPEHFTP